MKIDALGESNYQLLALNRNLNQIIRNINESNYDHIKISNIETLAQLMKKHTDIVSSAIRTSLNTGT